MPFPSEHATYADLFERMLDCVLLLDMESFAIVDANPACERLQDLNKESILGTPIVEWVEEAGRDNFIQALRIAKRRYYPRQFNCYWATKKGDRLFMEVSACALKLSDQSEVIQVIAKDITRQHEAEEKAVQYLKELEELNKKLEALSITDEMTKLANFRHFKFQLTQEHERAERYGLSYAILFCDVDNFKHYNDRNGHPAGDDVLRGVGEILRKVCRKLDLPARYGGEEFVVLCPETDLEKAMPLAKRLLETVANHPFKHAEHQPLGRVSISIGVASFPQDGKTTKDVLDSADEAVYSSKENGRNRITTTEDLKKSEKAAA